jgi:colicin import membrane protein
MAHISTWEKIRKAITGSYSTRLEWEITGEVIAQRAAEEKARAAKLAQQVAAKAAEAKAKAEQEAKAAAAKIAKVKADAKAQVTPKVEEKLATPKKPAAKKPAAPAAKAETKPATKPAAKKKSGGKGTSAIQ